MTLRNLSLISLVIATGLLGCQTYERRPLTLHGYADKWVDRSLDIEPVGNYAASLAKADGVDGLFDSTDGLSLREAEAVALHFNPQLCMARADAGVPLASAREAGWWPDPQFQAEVLRFLDRGDKTRFKFDGPSLDGINAGGIETTPVGFRRVQGDYVDDPWIAGASLSITIPISGRLAVEQELRWSQYSAAWRHILVAEWDLLTRLRAAWLEWSVSRERLTATRDYVTKLESIANMATQLMSAGEMKPTESRLLHVELARRRTAMLLFEQETEQHRLMLHAMMGLAPDAPVSLHPDVSIPSIDIPADQQKESLMQRHPRIKLAEANYESAEQQLRLEIRQQFPDLDIGPSYSLEEALTRLGLGISFKIPLWNRNRQAIAEAAAAREAARISAQAIVEKVHSELAMAQMQLLFAERQRAMLLDEVAPLVDQQVTDSRALLELGEVDVILLRDALTAFLDTKLDLLSATLVEGLAANTIQQMLRPRWFTPSQAASTEKNQ